MAFEFFGFGDNAAPLRHVHVVIARERLREGRTQEAVFDCVLDYENEDREIIRGCLYIFRCYGGGKVHFPPQILRLKSGRTIRFPAYVDYWLYCRIRDEVSRQLTWGDAA